MDTERIPVTENHDGQIRPDSLNIIDWILLYGEFWLSVKRAYFLGLMRGAHLGQDRVAEEINRGIRDGQETHK